MSNNPVFFLVNSSPDNVINNGSAAVISSGCSNASVLLSGGTGSKIQIQNEALQAPQKLRRNCANLQNWTPNYVVPTEAGNEGYNSFIPTSKPSRPNYCTKSMINHGINTNVPTLNHLPIRNQTAHTVYNGLHHRTFNGHIHRPSAVVRPIVQSTLSVDGESNIHTQPKTVPYNGKRLKRNRTALTTPQLTALESEFCRSKYLERSRRLALSRELILNEKTIKVWFQNRKMKEKKEVETDFCNDNIPHQPVPNNSNDHRSYQPVQIVISYPRYTKPMQYVALNPVMSYPGMTPQSYDSFLPYQMQNPPSDDPHQNFTKHRIEKESVVGNKSYVNISNNVTSSVDNEINKSLGSEVENYLVQNYQENFEECKCSVNISSRDDSNPTSTYINVAGNNIRTDDPDNVEENNQDTAIVPKHFLDISTSNESHNTSCDDKVSHHSIRADDPIDVVEDSQETIVVSRYFVDINSSNDSTQMNTYNNVENYSRIRNDEQSNVVENNEETVVISKYFVDISSSEDSVQSVTDSNIKCDSIKTEVQNVVPKSIRSRLVFEDDDF